MPCRPPFRRAWAVALDASAAFARKSACYRRPSLTRRLWGDEGLQSSESAPTTEGHGGLTFEPLTAKGRSVQTVVSAPAGSTTEAQPLEWTTRPATDSRLYGAPTSDGDPASVPNQPMNASNWWDGSQWAPRGVGTRANRPGASPAGPRIGVAVIGAFCAAPTFVTCAYVYAADLGWAHDHVALGLALMTALAVSAPVYLGVRRTSYTGVLRRGSSGRALRGRRY